MKKLKQIIAMYLAVIMCCLPVSNAVFAADISDGNQEQVSVDNGNLQVEGTDSVGDVLASAISSEQNAAEARSQSANDISGLEITGNTASVELQVETEADLVVAIYNEQQIQMLASGKTTVSSDKNKVEVNISGEIPEYFIASAYLLDIKTHEALCDAYTTELYTKEIKNLQDSTIKDFDEEKTVQLDGDNEKTNFAVYNTGTVVVDEVISNVQLVDDGSGKYTITNADSAICNLKKGDSLSYKYKDGTLLLVKVAEISVNGTTVEITEDSNAELKDYFDYVKIEADSSTGECTVDNSDLKEGITPVNSTKNVSEFSSKSPSPQANLSVTETITYDVEVKFENEELPEDKRDNITVKGSLEFGYGAYLEYYITPLHSYYSLELAYSQQVSVDITGKLARREIEIGHVKAMPIEGVIIGFTPSVIIEAAAEIYWSGKVEGRIGGNYDSKQGFSNTSTLPACKSEFKIEGTLYIGLKMAPYVSIISEKLDKIYMDLEGGVEFYAKAQSDNVSRDVIHECKVCFGGTITGKMQILIGIDIGDGKINESKEYSNSKKLTDFYWSVDRKEFGWTTCPHLRYPVNVTVKDNNGNSIKGKSTLTVTDKNSGNPVEILTKEQSMNSIEATDSQKTKFYLPNGDYTVNADTDTMAGKQDFAIKEEGTDVTVKLNMNKDQNIVWYIENNDTLHIGGTGSMPDYEVVSGKYSLWTSAPWSTEKIRNNTKKVIVDKGITSIGAYAFASLNYLEEVEIPQDIIAIGEYAFYDCSSLESMDIPETVTDIGQTVFGRCTKLLNVKLPSNITVIPGGMFVHCQNLKNVEIPDGVTEIGNSAFGGCESLTSIKIPEKVTTIGNQAFESCKNLDTLGIPASVKYVGDCAFCLNENQTIIFRGNKPEFGSWIFSGATDITVSYPADDSTWDGIESEDLGSTDIIWLPYNSNAVDSFSSEIDENDVDIVTEEFEIESEDPDFESDFSDSEDFAEEVIEIPEDTTEPDESIPDENEESDFSNSEEVVTILETPVSYAQDTADAGSSKMFSGLIPMERYVFIAVKNEQGDILESSNLLYIKQGTADKMGTISFRYMLKENFSNPVLKVYGKKAKDIKNLKVELSGTSYVYNGSAKRPSVKITDGSYTLKNRTDYTVLYSKNINAGTAVVQITGNGAYTGSKNVNFSIKQANAKLEFKSTKLTKKFGSSSFTNGFKTKKTDGKISYSSNNTKVASVDKNKGQIKIVGVGKATITATAKAGTNYKAGKTSFVLTVSKANNTIKANNITKNMSQKAQTVDIKASVKDKAKLTYSSNNKSVKVSSKGKITIAARFTGKAVIIIKAAKTAKYNSTSKKITVTVNKPVQSKINMDTFKKKSIRQWLEHLCYVRGFKDTTELKKKLPTIVRKDFLYVNRTKYKKYADDVDLLVPKKVVHDYIKDTYGITVSKVSLPVKNGKYLLKELWWQDATQVYFDKAVKTKDGAKIILKRKLFGKSVGQNEITVKPAKNSRGFVITSIKFYEK